MHRFTTELVIRAFILLVVGTSESVLVALLFVIACRTIVPILHVESAQETDILVGESFDNIGVAGADGARRRNSSRDVRDYGR